MEGFGLTYLEAGRRGRPAVACRTGGVEDAVLDGETGGDQHTYGVLHEDPTRQAGIKTNDHRSVAAAFEEVVGQPGSGSDDHRPVHPVRTGLDPAAQAGGAERQRPGHSFGEILSVACGEQFLELGARIGVGIAVDPGSGAVGERCRDGAHEASLPIGDAASSG